MSTRSHGRKRRGLSGTSHHAAQQVFQHQADAAISQANPVSTTVYPVLATTKNVRIISIWVKLTWAVTQPDPLEIIVTIDGIPITYSHATAISATSYYAKLTPSANAATQTLTATEADTTHRAFLLEGRSVKVDAKVTWATTQPNPLECRVKYAKIP